MGGAVPILHDVVVAVVDDDDDDDDALVVSGIPRNKYQENVTIVNN